MKFLFFLSLFIIFWALVGYPLSLKILKRLFSKRKLKKDYSYEPTVTVMVVAHNEEDVILDKLKNIINLEYNSNKIKFLITSDNSTDKTNSIVENFIQENLKYDIKLHKVKERKGKTNAQNEGQKLVDSEILVMTDANAMLKDDSIRELTSAFADDDISYVCGKLVYSNEAASKSSQSENTYWNLDLELRKIESDIQTITAGNGSLYACRNSEYVDLDPIFSHDANFPRVFALKGKRALFNPDAIVYEKAGETIDDEYFRKVRMNRGILRSILPNIEILNFFKYKWYTFFYIGHRTSRYLLWLNHLILFISNLLLIDTHVFYYLFLVGQSVFYLLAILNRVLRLNDTLSNLIFYYTITIIAQFHGIYNILTGQAKPFWEKAESTR